MKSEKSKGMTLYVIAAAFQKDTSSGVMMRHRLGRASGFRPDSTTLAAIQWLREGTGIDPEDRLVSHYVGPVNPFDTPTRCLISITMMPGGVSFASRLRQRRREYTISDDFTLFDAFNEMMREEESDPIIGWSVSPVELLP